MSDLQDSLRDIVRYGSAPVEVRTEDGGLVDPRVTTTVRAEDGRTIAVTRRDYTSLLLEDEVEASIRALMRRQHVEALIALRDGRYDAALAGRAPAEERAPTEAPTPTTLPSAAQAPKAPPKADPSGSVYGEAPFFTMDAADLLATLDKVVMDIKSSLEALSSLDGFYGAALVDADSGMMLGSLGGGPVNLEIAAAGNTEVVRAKRRTMHSLGLNEEIDDILISLSKQYHIIRPLSSQPMVFFYVVLDRSRANLALARIKLASVEKELKI